MRARGRDIHDETTKRGKESRRLVLNDKEPRL